MWARRESDGSKWMGNGDFCMDCKGEDFHATHASMAGDQGSNYRAGRERSRAKIRTGPSEATSRTPEANPPDLARVGADSVPEIKEPDSVRGPAP